MQTNWFGLETVLKGLIEYICKHGMQEKSQDSGQTVEDTHQMADTEIVQIDVKSFSDIVLLCSVQTMYQEGSVAQAKTHINFFNNLS